LLTDFVCLYNYEFWLSLCKIVRSSVVLLLPLFCVVCSSSIYGFWLPLWYLQTLLICALLIYLRILVSTWFPYHLMFVSFESNTSRVISGAGTANKCWTHDITHGFSVVRVDQSLVFCLFCRFVLFLSHCIVCPIWLPIATLVSSRNFEDTKGIIRSRKSKDRQRNGQKNKQRSTTYYTKTLFVNIPKLHFLPNIAIICQQMITSVKVVIV
jgi:hypothetical protein